jgi:heparosan-N-sulfate-glucuronate 5-epimerase
MNTTAAANCSVTRSRFSYVSQPPGRNFRPGQLGGYYNDLSQKALQQRGDLGERPAGENPVNIAQTCLGFHELWLTSEQNDYLQSSIRLADWLVAHQRDGRWVFDFSWYYGLKPPWISAMAQGEGISALLRVHKATGDKRYLEAARAALDPFRQEVQTGGVRVSMGKGQVFFEEYPSDPPSHVLNGFVFALWGLYDYALYMRDDEVEELFRAGLRTLVALLPEYDLGYWSAYDLFPFKIRFVAHPFYHQLHIAQLEALFQLTGRTIFRDTARSWESYRRSRISRWRRAGHAVLFKVYSRCSKIGRIAQEE